MGRLIRRRHIGGSAPDQIGGPGSPEPFNFTRDVIEARAADSQRRALRFVDTQGVIDKRSYDDLARAAARWAALLRSRELTPGDRVVVLLDASPTWPAVLLGALKAGFVVVPCERAIPNDELELRLRHAHARLLVVDGERAASLPELDAVVQVLVCEEAASELQGLGGAQPTHDTTVDDPAIVISPPDAAKGLLSHGGTRGALELVEHGLDVRPDDLVWCAAETGSSTWLWNGLLVPWAAGASTVIHDADFDPQERLELIQRLGVTVLRQRPDEYRQLVEQPVRHGELDGLRRAVSVGGPVDPEVADAFRAHSGVTVEEEVEDGMLTEESGAPEPHALATTTGLLEALSNRVSVVPEDGQAAPLTAAAAVAAAPDDRVTRDEVTAAEARRLDDERRDAERRAAAARADAEALERKLQEAAAADAARAAAEKAKAEERERRQREKDAAREAELTERRAEEEGKAAAARAQADARERKRQEAAAAEAAKRAAAEERRAAEAMAKAAERERKQREKDAAREAKVAERQAKELRKAAAAQAAADARERKRQEAAAAEAAKRAAAEERRAAEAKAKEDERRRKQQEKEAAAQARRAEEERKAAAARGEADARERKRREAAAEAAKHTEKEERRTAAAKVKDDERHRKQEEREAAAQARRHEEERRAAARREADRREAEKAEQRRLARGTREEAERQRREERPQREEPVAVPHGNGNAAPGPGDGPNEGLMERLSAYTHHTDAASEDPPPQ